jgi:hypothetical protein
MTDCPHFQTDTPFIFAVLGGVVVVFYLVKLVTLAQMRDMEKERRHALSQLKQAAKPQTPESERHSVPVTPSTASGRQHEDDWHVTDY